MTPPTPINLAQAFSRFSDQWSPRIVARVNDCEVKLARLEGEFIWHHHPDEDELFLVIKGRLGMRLRDGDRWIEEGEMILIPRGTEHCPFAPEECQVMLFEPAGTRNTGNLENERTVDAKPV